MSMVWCRNIAENYNRLSKAHERYRQTTDRVTDRWVYNDIIANVNFAKNLLTIFLTTTLHATLTLTLTP